MIMKKKIAGIALLIAAAVLLSACANSAVSGQVSGAGNKTGSASGTVNTASQSGEGAAPGQDVQSQGTQGQASQSQETVNQQGQSREAQADQEVQVDGPADGNGTYDIDNQSGDPAASPAQDSGALSAWNGTYVSEEGETLTIEAQDDSTISFSFLNSGIASTANVEGMGANYDGDDNMDVAFTLTGDVIGVSVMNVETGEAEVSAITGTYQRQ